MLDRLRITQRLSLLLLLPLGSVVLLSIPFTVERVDDARAAATVADSANNARSIDAVIQELQQERLLALAYLGSTRMSRSALVAQIQSTVDGSARARNALSGPTNARLRDALTGLDRINVVRQSVLDRRARVADVYRAYHGAAIDLIDALRLPDQPSTDATGLRQMSSLDTLLRSNEEGNQVGAALVIAAIDPAAAPDPAAATDPATAAGFASSARVLEQVHLKSFRQQGDPLHVALLDQAGDRFTSARAEAILASLTGANSSSRRASIDESLSLAQAGVAIRRVAQDRIARDIATSARGRADAATAVAITVATLATGLLALVTWMGAVVSRSIARPLRRVTLAATAVADLASRELQRVTDVESDDDTGPPRLAALTVRTSDEVGELASAFNRVQATAALLMEQQVITRRNVAVMFGHIANRTQSLASRQLAQIDELERKEDDEQRLENLYRLDHLTARLRRSADSLLVIAGARDDAHLVGPSALAEVIRSAAAEVEGYRSIALREICDVIIVAAAVGDLTLLLAELLDNATTFSPPEEPVEVFASVRADCVIRIVDRGIGMTAERLAEENDRLVSRERLDVAPTTMLGLFVVGRLARRHGIDVRLFPTPGVGITAEVVLPIFIQVRPERAPGPAAGPPAATLRAPLQRAPLELDAAPATFGWFDHPQPQMQPQPQPVAPRHTANGTAVERAQPTRGGLRQRRPGHSLPYDDSPLEATGAQTAIRGTAWVPAVRDPDAERAGLNAFTDGAVRAVGESRALGDRRAAGESRALERTARADALGRLSTELFVAGPDSRGGLNRRHPGTHLAQNLQEEMGRPDPIRAESRVPKGRMRDAEAERAQLEGYLEGLARAGGPGSQFRDLWS